MCACVVHVNDHKVYTQIRAKTEQSEFNGEITTTANGLHKNVYVSCTTRFYQRKSYGENPSS